MYVCECECAYVCVCECLSEHRGGGSPGAWQYGAVVRHTPVKMPPMGLGQLWPAYTASWAITSLMTYSPIHIHSPITTILAALSGCLSLFCLSVRNFLSVCLYLVQHTWENSPYFPFFPVQVLLPDICGGTPFSLFSFIQPTRCASHAATWCPDKIDCQGWLF